MKKNLTLLLLCCAFVLSAQVTLIPNASVWKYKDDGSNQGTAWYGTAFNDAGWASGTAEFGYGDGDETTLVNACGTVTSNPSCSNKYITTYFRQTFSVSSASSYTSFTANLRRDDGIVLYVNGQEVYRSNMPTGTITHTTLASSAASDDGATILNATIPTSIIVSGTNVIAAEIHQNAATSSDLTFILSLTGNTLAPNPATVSVFPNGSSWKYLDNGTDQGSAWYGTAYNDGSWASGNSELGYGDGDETTVVGFGINTNAKYPTTYFRKTFSLTTQPSYTAYAAKLKRDDGIILYVNGVEVYRENMPASGVNYTTYASSNCADDGGSIWTATIPASLIVTGTNVIAAEIHQTNATSSDLTFECNLIAITNSIAPVVPLIVKGPYLVVGTPTSMVVRWETDIASNTQVMYGTNSNSLNTIITNTNVVTIHSVQINGLTPYTKYFYNVGSTSLVTQGDTNNYFVTNPTPGTPGNYRFWVVGDCGNASSNQTNCKNSYLAYNGNRVTNAILLSGDNAYNSGTDAEYNSKFFAIYQNDALKKMTMYSAPGNHDYNNGASTATTVPYFTHFQTPTNGQSGGIASNNPAYYSFDYGNVHFLSLDSYGTTGASQKMYDTTGAQVNWIKQDLASNNKKWTIAYWHHPPYTMGSHNSDTEGDLVNIRTRFIRILERSGVDMIITGHSHDYERTKLINGHYGNEASFNATSHNLSSSTGLYDGSANSCPYEKDSLNNKVGTVYVLSGSAGQLGGQQGSFPHNSMYYSNATNGGTFILDIEDNKLDAKWLCADGVIRDKFTMVKDVSTKNSYTTNPSESVTLTATWPGSYTWNNAATTRSIVVNPTTTTTYYVNDPNSCITDTFKVKVKPASSFTSNPPYCVSQPVMFGDNSTNNSTSWTWSVNPSVNATISNSVVQNPNIIFNSNGVYTISLLASNNYGNGIAYSQTVNINSISNFGTINGNTSVCSGKSTTLSLVGAQSYSWNTGATSSVVVVTPNTTTIYTLTATDANGCQTILQKSVSINSLPTISVTSNPNNAVVCFGSSLSLNASGATSYTWSGLILNNTTFTPATSTNYTVTATDANGCENTAVKSITVNALPTISVIATPTNAATCLGSSLTLAGGGATTYTWTGGITNNTSFIPTTNTTYSVTGTDNNGCLNTAVKSITVNALPTLTISGAPSVCLGNSVTLTASGASTYSWVAGSIGNTEIVNPTTNTTYTVNGTDANGCKNTTTKLITVNQNPVIQVNSGTVCPGYSFTMIPNGAVSYTFSNASNTVLPVSTTVYSVSGTNSLGCISSAPATATVHVINSLNISISGNTVICKGQSISLTASGANSYTWSTAQTGTSIVSTPSVSSAYTVTGSTPNCSNTAQFNVTVNNLPTVSINSNTTQACEGKTVALTANGAQTYTWNTTSNLSAVTVTVEKNSNLFTVWGTDANGCSNVVSKTITVLVLPSIDINSSSNLICAGETATLNASGASTYSWNAITLTGSTLAITPSVTTSYSVNGTDANGCVNKSTFTQNVSECTDVKAISSGSNKITIYPNPSRGLVNVEVGTYENCSIEIYNSLGQRIMFTKLNSGVNTFTLAENKGVYFYKITKDKETLDTGKLILE